jgi:hypothetical protein
MKIKETSQSRTSELSCCVVLYCIMLCCIVLYYVCVCVFVNIYASTRSIHVCVCVCSIAIYVFAQPCSIMLYDIPSCFTIILSAIYLFFRATTNFVPSIFSTFN